MMCLGCLGNRCSLHEWVCITCSGGSSNQHFMGLVLVPHEQRESCHLLVSMC